MPCLSSPPTHPPPHTHPHLNHQAELDELRARSRALLEDKDAALEAARAALRAAGVAPGGLGGAGGGGGGLSSAAFGAPGALRTPPPSVSHSRVPSITNLLGIGSGGSGGATPGSPGRHSRSASFGLPWASSSGAGGSGGGGLPVSPSRGAPSRSSPGYGGPLGKEGSLPRSISLGVGAGGLPLSTVRLSSEGTEAAGPLGEAGTLRHRLAESEGQVSEEGARSRGKATGV